MGYFNHHAIVVIGTSTTITSAHDLAKATGAQVSELVESAINGYQSFLVAPDGSKEGWEESAAGDERRAKIVDHLRAVHLLWSEVSFPEGEPASVVDCSEDE